MQACKDGFKARCRPIISLDRCHLKGYYGGHILAAVGIDVDDYIYPIAYACVESECGQSWALFLDILKDDMDIVNSYHISFMSDRQKVRTTRKQVPFVQPQIGQPPIEQSQTATQPPRTRLVKQPYQPRQKQPIKRKEPVVQHDSRKKQEMQSNVFTVRWMPTNTQDSTATTQDTPRSNVTNTREKVAITTNTILGAVKKSSTRVSILHDVLRSASSPQLHFGVSLLESIFRIGFLLFSEKFEDEV
ncbi:hypothetical protein V6N13_142344 [Hibiscus sabdariffa]